MGRVIDVVRAAALTGFENLVRALGVDPAPLLRRHGIGVDDLRQPDSLIRPSRWRYLDRPHHQWIHDQLLITAH